MDTEIYGQIPIFSHGQMRKQYVQAIKEDLENLDSLVEEGIVPFPKKEELTNEKIERGLNHALSKIESAQGLPNIFMIDTEQRDGEGRGPVWIVANGEVVDFTRTPILHESKIGA